jgi:hypothetical protein
MRNFRVAFYGEESLFMTPHIFYSVELLLYDTERRFLRFRMRISPLFDNEFEKRSALA